MLVSPKEKTFHLIEIIELAVAKTWWAVSFIAVNAEVAILIGIDNILAPEALACDIFLVLSNHALMVLTATVSMLLNALVFGAKTKSLLLSSVENEFVGQVINDIIAMSVQLVDVELLDALVRSKLSSSILLVANLAHHLHFWTFFADVIIQLGPSQVLELFPIANVAAKLWTGKLSVSLELAKGLPNDLRASPVDMTSMWELTEVNAVS